MAFKDILLTLTSYPDPTPVSVVEDAVSLAATLGAHLSAVSCEVHVQVPGHFLPVRLPTFPASSPVRRKRAGSSAKDLLAAFDAAAAKSGVPHEVFLEKCPTFKVPDLLVDYARLRDLTIVPVPESYDQWYAETVIFGSGRPTLVLPDGFLARAHSNSAPSSWHGISAAPQPGRFPTRFPCSRRAKNVRVVTVTNEKDFDTNHSAEELAKNLARHGIEVRAGQDRCRRQADRRGS